MRRPIPHQYRLVAHPSLDIRDVTHPDIIPLTDEDYPPADSALAADPELVYHSGLDPALYTFAGGQILVDIGPDVVRVNEKIVQLGKSNFRILACLAANTDMYVSTRFLGKLIYPPEVHASAYFPALIGPRIGNIRAVLGPKLGHAREGAIQNEFGSGYRVVSALPNVSYPQAS